jgi:uncharacterized protein with PCYCGC motif
METSPATRTYRLGRRIRYLLPVVVLVLVGGTTFAACGAGHATGTEPGSIGSMATAMPAGSAMASGTTTSAADDAAPAGADDAWAYRPAFTGVSAATEAAYHYALYHPQVVQWMPCYCGCAAMDHRSNLDCYLKSRTDGRVVFEEHASYCDLCVQITLKTRDLLAQGASLHGAREAIDALFAGDVPGTPTEVPPG